MTINRHNYETFFLLYVDNELSATERKAVEQFVQENIDLKPELQLLLETTLPSDKICFDAKNGLLKNEAELDAVRENLLLLLDNELSPDAARETASAISSNDSIKREWRILQQTKLAATDKIIFENKELLYRQEKGRVITVRFWKFVAAAAILFACLFTVISLLKKDGNTEEIVTKKTIKPATEIQPYNAVDPVQTTVPENIASVNETVQKTTTLIPAVKMNTTQEKREIISNEQLVLKENNTSKKTSLENINNKKSNEAVTIAVIDKRKEMIVTDKLPDETAKSPMKEKITVPEVPIIDYNSIPAKTDSYAKTAVLDEPAPGNSNKILYMNEENVVRSKIGGIFRRVKRTIERNTNIKTGNGVKIAGFEIALK